MWIIKCYGAVSLALCVAGCLLGCWAVANANHPVPPGGTSCGMAGTLQQAPLVSQAGFCLVIWGVGPNVFIPLPSHTLLGKKVQEEEAVDGRWGTRKEWNTWKRLFLPFQSKWAGLTLPAVFIGSSFWLALLHTNNLLSYTTFKFYQMTINAVRINFSL